MWSRVRILGPRVRRRLASRELVQHSGLRLHEQRTLGTDLHAYRQRALGLSSSRDPEEQQWKQTRETICIFGENFQKCETLTVW